MLIELLIDAQGFVEKLVLFLLSDLSELNPVIVIKSVDVVHDSGLVSLDGSQDQQVLQVLVAREVRVVQHDPLQQLDQLVRHVGVHERLHSCGDLVRVLSLREGGLHDLVDNLFAVGVFFLEDVGPKLGTLSLHEVASLHTVEVVAVGNLNELHVARAPGTLVGNEGEVWVALLTEFTNNLAVIEGVVDQESLRVLVNIDVNHSKGIVKSRLLDSFLITRLKPSLQQLQFASLFKLLYQLWDGAHSD